MHGGPGSTGRPHRIMLEAMLWILRPGAPWRDLPPEYGSWQTVYTRFSRWSQKGVLKRVFDKLAQESGLAHLKARHGSRGRCR